MGFYIESLTFIYAYNNIWQILYYIYSKTSGTFENKTSCIFHLYIIFKNIYE